MIMDYLRDHNMLSSLLTLEKEAQLSLYKYPKEIQFLRNLILEGQWNDADGFIKTIFENLLNDETTQKQNQADFEQLNLINFQIKK